MRFYSARKHRAPTIIIVALIDILIVMLIFLLVTTTFKQHPAVKLTLPEAASGVRGETSEGRTLVVVVDKHGHIMLGSDSRPVRPDQLERAMRVLVKDRGYSHLSIAADQEAPFGAIIKVMDAARMLGLESVRAYTRHPDTAR